MSSYVGLTENKTSSIDIEKKGDPDKRIESQKKTDISENSPFNKPFVDGAPVSDPDKRIPIEKSETTIHLEDKNHSLETWSEIFNKEFCDEIKLENSSIEQDSSLEKSNELSNEHDNILTEIPGGGEPNAEYNIDGHIYKTDDNGNIYNVDGKNLPNCKYELNGYEYETDDKGRIIKAEGDIKIPEYKPRPKYLPDIDDRRSSDDERGSDDRGHLIAHEFGGADTEGNLVPMNSEVNQSGEYRKLEQELRKAKEEGHDVHVKVEPQYEDDSNRPSSFIVTYTIDGETYEKIIINEAKGASNE